MSDIALHHMTNIDESSVLTRAATTLRTWRRRARERQQLARLSRNEMHDIGLNPGEVAWEAGKPFWQA